MRLHTIIQHQPDYKCLYLTLNIPVVCVCAASFNVNNGIFPHTVYSSINVISHNEQSLLAHTAFTDGSTLFCVCERYAVSLSV